MRNCEKKIEKGSHALFASSLKQRDFWLGYGKASVSELRDRYGGCKPCLWGFDVVDAHAPERPARTWSGHSNRKRLI